MSIVAGTTSSTRDNPRPEAAGSRESCHLLVIDDETPLLELLKLYFEENGFRVDLAASSAEGFQSISREKPAVIILDINLQGEDGLKILPRLKEQSPECKVIMLTGMGYPPDLLHEALLRGADGYVAKGNTMLFDLLQNVRSLTAA